MHVDGCVSSLFWMGGGGAANTTKLNYVIACGLSVFCRVAVNCFYMISGSFIRENNNEVTLKNVGDAVFKQYKKVWMYSVLIFFAATVGRVIKFSLNGMLDALFPIMSNTWWFATVFLLLTCLRPFISKVLPILNDRELLVLLICVGFFDTVQAVVGVNAFGERGAGILHATFMLIVGYSIKRWNGLSLSKLAALLLYFVNCTIAGLLAIVEKKLFSAEDAHALYYNSPLIVIAAIAFFVFFLKTSCSWEWPKSIAPYVFAIYLINDHPIVREFAWQKILHCSSYYGSKLMVLHWLFSVILFVIIGITVDYFMEKLASDISIIRREK